MTEPTESIVQLGADGTVLGIVTLPTRPDPDAPACLLMNAGVVHRIGPHRLNVKIARGLAQLGIASIRIDLAGLGDSPAQSGAAHSGAQTQVDLQAAMDHLEQAHGIRRFIVFGLCSGAVHAYWLAQKDERIAGVLLFDIYAYPTFKTHLVRRWRRFRSASWSALARKPVDWIRRPRSVELPGASSQDPHLMRPTPAQFAQVMNEMTARGVSVYLYYSSSFLEKYNYRGQMNDYFGREPFMARVRHDYEADVDHTVTTQHAQRKLLASVMDWAQSVAGGKSGSST